MDHKRVLAVFEGKGIRKEWHNEEGYFLAVEAIAALTDSPTPRQYWGKVKNSKFKRLELSPIWVQLNEISAATFGVPIKKHRQIKSLDPKFKNGNLRDYTTDLELIFNMRGKKVTAEITNKDDSQDFSECENAAQRGGKVAGKTRVETEKEIGRKIVSSHHYLDLQKKKKLEQK